MIRKIPIKQKKKQCCICGEETYIFSKKRCKPCALKQDTKPLQTSKIKLKVKRKPKNKELSTYFEKHIEILYRFKKSEESGIPIPFPTNVNICHLVDKARHKSIASHLDNCIYLTLDEHTKLDQYLFRHEFAKVKENFPNSWGLIKARLNIVIPLCKEKTKYLTALSDFILEN